MKIPRSVLCWLALTLSCSFAVAAPEPLKSGGDKHCLWRVTNAKAPFYLLGTMHSLPLRNWKFPPVIENAILDKDCRIGRDVRIVNRRGVREEEGVNYVIRDGIVVIPKGIVVPDGMEI